VWLASLGEIRQEVDQTLGLLGDLAEVCGAFDV
jgi:hypothetical protein